MNRIIIVLTFFTIIILKVSAAPKKEWLSDKQMSVVNFVYFDPLPIIEVMINGKKIHCLVDEEDDSFLLDRETAKSAGIKSYFNMKVKLDDGEKVKIGLAKSKELQVGSLKLKKVPTILMELQEILEEDDEVKELLPTDIKITGIIGLEGLEEYHVAVSLSENKELVFEEK